MIGTKYGAGDGSTTFNLPDMRECVPVGAGTSTRSDIGTHDALELGKYRADSFASHSHNMDHTHCLGNNYIGGTTGDISKDHSHSVTVNTYAQGTYYHTDASSASIARHHLMNDGANSTYTFSTGGVSSNHNHSWGGSFWTHVHPFYFNGEASNLYDGKYYRMNTANSGGTTTHGKQLGVNFIIKY